MRKHNVRPYPDISNVSSCIQATISEHIETPKSVYDLVDEYKHLNGNWEEYDHEFFEIGQNSSTLYIQTNQKTK